MKSTAKSFSSKTTRAITLPTMHNMLVMLFLLFSVLGLGAQNQVNGLYLELIRTESLPVIDSLNPDSRDIPGGFEAGSTLKLAIKGDTSYYMITSAMGTRPDGIYRWTHMRTELWISKDAYDWKRHRILFHPHFDQTTGLWQLTGSPFPFFDESENRWYIYFNYMAFNGIRNWDTPCLLRRAGALEGGLEGIKGEFEFPGEIVAPSGIAHPTDAEASSISPPFIAGDGNWYAFLGGGPKPFDSNSGRWWSLIVKADSPKGPFVYMPEYAPVPIMEPTGYVENPLPMKLTGPVSGKEYWAIIFNYLKGEVTTGQNSEIGFSSSPDGLTWSEKNVQIIDMREGLPDNQEEWWRAIRVPHQLIDEGNGIYTCLFSAYDKHGDFEGIGKATFRLREHIANGASNENIGNKQNGLKKRQFPILAWIGPPARLLTDAAWEAMARAGFNLCNPLTFFDSVSNKKALALGEKYGIGILVRDPRIHYEGKPKEKSGIEEAVHRWMNEPAFAGYSVKDEPSAKDFKELARIKRIITGIDNSHRVYVNLFPTYASEEQLGKSTYKKHVKSFMRIFRPGVLSYDYYSITKEEEGETVRTSYYENMEIIRRAALKAKVPFSTFTLSIPHWSYPTPTEGHVRFQLYSALAYGAKELQYFTYGTVENNPEFGDALIDSAGNTTATYEIASKINWEIQHMGPVLLDLESTDVFHTAPQPLGTTAFSGYGGVKACSGGPAVLGFFDDSEGQKWLMVVNRNPFAPVKLTLTFKAGIDSIGEVNKTTAGGIVNELGLSNQQLILPLTAGEGRLFRIGT